MFTSSIKKRNHFQRLILKHLFFRRGCTCVELSEIVEKSVPLTLYHLEDLKKQGFLVEKGYGPSSGGRRPQNYGLNPEKFGVICVAMDQFLTRIAYIAADSEVPGPVEQHPLTLSNNPGALEQLAQLIEGFIENRQLAKTSVTAIGIGMPGFIDSKKGLNHSFLPVSAGSIVSYIENRVGLPVLIENDSSVIALAELRWGAARDKQNTMVINVGWGVGLGIIANGRLFKGHDGFAGEFSHIPLFDNHKICTCGKYGCLETETSLSVIAQKAVDRMLEGAPTILTGLSRDEPVASALKILAAAQKGDKFSIELISGAAYHIGRGIAILIHLFNPELVLISGLGATAGKVWAAPIQQAINEHCIPKIAEQTEVRISAQGEVAALLGAAALVAEGYEAIKDLY